jgi:hypothetical protein
MTTVALNAPGRWLRPGDVDPQELRPTVTKLVGAEPTEWDPPPVVYSGPGSVFLNLGSMKRGRFYAVTLEGVELAAVKNQDDSVSFYAAPDSEP